MLGLAHQYGWEPAGTEPPEWRETFRHPDGTPISEGLAEQFRAVAEDWDGGYSTNDYQVVTDEDAANIADALERALEHIPDERTVGMLAASKDGAVDIDTSRHLSSLDWFSGGGKETVREFVAYCRAGGFAIG
jgi:hypothetical protein